jgi:membrane fusion protein
MTAQQAPALGAVLLVRRLSMTVLTLVALSSAVCVVLLSFRGEYTRKARVTGYLVPTQGLIKVYSRETGTIVEKRVAEGLRVSKGDVLFVVSMEHGSRDTAESQGAAIAKVSERRDSLKAEIARQDEIVRIEAQGLRQRIKAMESEVAEVAQQIRTEEMSVASAETTLRMYQRLFAESLVSVEQIEEKRKGFLEQQGRLQALQRNQIALIRERDTLRVQLAASGMKSLTERAVVDRSISTIDQELTEYEARRTFVVTAPADGTATAVLAERGQTATPTQPLVSLLPSGAVLQAHLFVPSQSIGFIANGQQVALQYQAFPYQRFGSYAGRVAEISRTLILPSETNVSFALREPAYRVIVLIDSQSVKAYGQDFLLQSGMLLDANISLDRRRVYQWLLDPIYSVRGRV